MRKEPGMWPEITEQYHHVTAMTHQSRHPPSKSQSEQTSGRPKAVNGGGKRSEAVGQQPVSKSKGKQKFAATASKRKRPAEKHGSSKGRAAATASRAQDADTASPAKRRVTAQEASSVATSQHANRQPVLPDSVEEDALPVPARSMYSPPYEYDRSTLANHVLSGITSGNGSGLRRAAEPSEPTVASQDISSDIAKSNVLYTVRNRKRRSFPDNAALD